MPDLVDMRWAPSGTPLKWLRCRAESGFRFREILASLPARLLLSLDYVGQTYFGLVKRNCSPSQQVILSKIAVL